MSFSEKKGEISIASAIEQDITSEFEYKNEKGVIDIDRSHAGSTAFAYFNVVCVIAGTGTLGLPYALALGGWIGLLILFLSWFMSTYTAVILIRCLYAGGPRRLSTYKEVASAAFGAIGGWVTFFFNAWILLGTPILYMVLAGTNLNHLCAGTAGEIGTTPWIIICCAMVAIPFVIVKNMKEVAWMSAFGAASTVVTVIIVLVVSCIDQKNQNNHHDNVIWPQFPIALSTIAFSFGGNVVYPHVEASMKKPKDWTKAVTGGLATCAALYFMTAVPGYYIYGTSAVSPIYDSIPDGPAKIVAVVMMTIHVLLAAPILVTSFSLDLEDMLNITVERFGRVREFIYRAVFRVATMVVIGVVGCSVPHFGSLMSLIGAFANCALVFIFPILFYLKLTGVRNKSIFELAFAALTVVLGIVGLIFGTIDAVKALIRDYQ